MREVFQRSQVNATYIGYQGERWRLYPLQLHCCIKRAGYQKGFSGIVHFFPSIHLAVQVYAPPALLAGERERERPRPRGNPLGPLHLIFSWLAQTLTGKCMKMKEKEQDQAVPCLVRSIWFFSGWAQTLTLKKYECETWSMGLELHWHYIEESLILPQSPGQIQRIPN